MQKTELTQHYHKQAAMREKWIKMWSEFEEQFAELPRWAQEILLQDISAAFQTRINVMRRTQDCIDGGN
ncbi:MAG: hypothetical protein ACE14S_09265 [Candidatus Bathyarchaeia archaeon]